MAFLDSGGASNVTLVEDVAVDAGVLVELGEFLGLIVRDMPTNMGLALICFSITRAPQTLGPKLRSRNMSHLPSHARLHKAQNNVQTNSN